MEKSIFQKIVKHKIATEKTWDQIAAEAGIPVASWMTGLPFSEPTEAELRKLAPVLGLTYEDLTK